MNVFLIGAGKVAAALASELNFCGFYARDKFKAIRFSNTTGLPHYSEISSIPKADIYIVAINDDSVEELTSIMTSYINNNSVIAHTSGSLPLEAIDSRFTNRAVLYPLHPFAEGVKTDLKKIVFLTEFSSLKAKNSITSLSQNYALETLDANYKHRKQIHLAAVFASNFTNHLFAISQDLLKDSGYDFNLLSPLVKQLFENLSIENVDIRSLQTGPACRGDKKVIREHLEFLKDKNSYKKIYTILTESIKNEKF